MASTSSQMDPALDEGDDNYKLRQWLMTVQDGNNHGSWDDIVDSLDSVLLALAVSDRRQQVIVSLTAELARLRAELARAQELSSDARRLIAIYANEEHTDPRDAEIERLRGEVDEWRREAMRWTKIGTEGDK